jgi:hypothetical protein
MYIGHLCNSRYLPDYFKIPSNNKWHIPDKIIGNKIIKSLLLSIHLFLIFVIYGKNGHFNRIV